MTTHGSRALRPRVYSSFQTCLGQRIVTLCTQTSPDKVLNVRTVFNIENNAEMSKLRPEAPEFVPGSYKSDCSEFIDVNDPSEVSCSGFKPRSVLAFLLSSADMLTRLRPFKVSIAVHVELYAARESSLQYCHVYHVSGSVGLVMSILPAC